MQVFSEVRNSREVSPHPGLPLPAFLGVFQQEINIINIDTIPIRQHDVMVQF
jgi:hypothetical protein